MDRSAFVVVNVPPEVYELVRLAVHLAGCLDAEYVGEGIPFVRHHMISALASDTVRPNDAHMTTITHIIFLIFLGTCETTLAKSA